MMRFLTQKIYMSYPREIRAEIVKHFNLKRSTGFVTIDNKLVSDGHADEDLQHLDMAEVERFVETLLPPPDPAGDEPVPPLEVKDLAPNPPKNGTKKSRKAE
jgi:hypothetical protein